MSETPDNRSEPTTGDSRVAMANMLTLEICFLAIVALIVVAAFFEALTYQMVSARTPFVIIVPLFLLILVQGQRLFLRRHYADLKSRLAEAVNGRIPTLNKIVAMSGWMTLLLALIQTIGHYAGLLIFSFCLMRLIAKEKLALSLIVSGVTTGLIFVLFEYGFNVEMYRGLLFRYFAGYNDF